MSRVATEQIANIARRDTGKELSTWAIQKIFAIVDREYMKGHHQCRLEMEEAQKRGAA